MLLEDIEAYLNTFAPWTQSGTTYTVRRGFLPDSQDGTLDAVIALMEFPAGPDMKAMGPSLRTPVRERAGLMVVTRGPRESYPNARAMAEQVHLKLAGFTGTLSGRRYRIDAMHVPARRRDGQDRNDRWEIEANYVVLKERG